MPAKQSITNNIIAGIGFLMHQAETFIFVWLFIEITVYFNWMSFLLLGAIFCVTVPVLYALPFAKPLATKGATTFTKSLSDKNEPPLATIF